MKHKLVQMIIGLLLITGPSFMNDDPIGLLSLALGLPIGIVLFMDPILKSLSMEESKT